MRLSMKMAKSDLTLLGGGSTSTDLYPGQVGQVTFATTAEDGVDTTDLFVARTLGDAEHTVVILILHAIGELGELASDRLLVLGSGGGGCVRSDDRGRRGTGGVPIARAARHVE